jgi:hypothetical protein
LPSFRFSGFCAPPLPSLAFGVGQKPDNPDSVSELGRVHGTSRNIEALHFVAAPSHLRKYSVEPHVEDARRVLENDAIRLCFIKHAQSRFPEPMVISRASLLPGSTGRLTWWSSGEKRDSSIFPAVEFSNVAFDWQSPFGFEELRASFFDLTERNRFESRFLRCDCEPSNPTKEVKMGRLLIHVVPL